MTEPSSKHKPLIEEALERWRLSEKAFHHSRKLQKDDLEFEAGYDEQGRSTQWSELDLKQWEDDKRPALTINYISQFTNQVVNESRQLRPSIEVNPVDSYSDPVTAETLQGIIRSIEQNSHAEVAYDTASELQKKCGFGCWRIGTKYSYDNPKNEQEFHAQHIEIKRIRNPFTVFPDPTGVEIDGSDWEYCLIVEDMLKEFYKRKYKNSQMASLDVWSSVGDAPPEWITGQSVRIAEYYYAKHHEEKICVLSDGRVVSKRTLDDNVKKYGSAGLADGVRVIAERGRDARSIHWAKFNALEVLEETDLPGIYIPVVPAYGNELNIDGKSLIYGMVRNGKGIQQALNYMVSSAVEAIGLMPKSPWIVAAGQIDAFLDVWKVANKKAFTALEYTPVSIDGVLAPPPQRQTYEPAIQAFNQMMTQFQYSMKGAMGMYGPSLSEPSGEQSGVAIRTRQFQGQRATYHFQGNWERAMWHTGRILLNWIPEVYDDQQVLQIIGKDNKTQTVTLDNTIGNLPEERAEAAKNGRFNIHVGRYDVTISVGPGFATLRQERVAQVSEILKTWPNLLPAIGHILFRNMDLEGADEIADELLKLKNQGQQGLPPQIQQQMQLMQNQIRDLLQQLNQAKQREMAKIVELESNARIEAVKAELESAKLQAQVAMKMGELESRESLELLKQQLAGIQQSIEQLRETNTPQGQDGLQGTPVQ